MHRQGLVVFAKNKERVSAFYQQTLGLELRESDASYDLLQGHGYEVIIHTVPQEHSAEITVSNPPQAREETPFKPTSVVASLLAVRREVDASGGYLKPETDSWQFRCQTVLDGWDPEGNIVQFKQPE